MINWLASKLPAREETLGTLGFVSGVVVFFAAVIFLIATAVFLSQFLQPSAVVMALAGAVGVTAVLVLAASHARFVSLRAAERFGHGR